MKICPECQRELHMSSMGTKTLLGYIGGRDMNTYTRACWCDNGHRFVEKTKDGKVWIEPVASAGQEPK